MINEEQAAPLFTLPDQHGKAVSLSQFKGKKKVVLFFYPRDFTPGCTAESCSFRDNYQDFFAENSEVIGISGDSSESHAGFAQKHELQYTLLADKDGEVAKAYGVKKTFGIFPGRATFVIDSAGIIKGAFSSQVQVNMHIKKALEVVKLVD